MSAKGVSDQRGGAMAGSARTADAAFLAQALQDARSRTLALFAAFEQALAPAGMVVPYSPQLNPPLWELGHIGWFQERWLARNPQRDSGAGADPEVARTPGRLADADAIYNSSLVPHTTRWHLPLPGADATRDYLAATLQDSLRLLAQAGDSDDALYFYRLALFHEYMHAEAATYMAQALGIQLGEEAGETQSQAGVVSEMANEGDGVPLQVAAREWALGSEGTPGFAFDNELRGQSVALRAFEIDAAPVTWARFLPFVEAGGYGDERFWSAQGWAWLQSGASGWPLAAGSTSPPTAGPLRAPRYLRQLDGAWQTLHFGHWQVLDLHAPAVHLSAFEADAWCRWAGRRLPTEAEWECVAMTSPAFQWGTVWDWTASIFQPFAGFAAHPYRDYSAPWFDTHRVLKGGCTATSPRMKHPKYRNFFSPERSDVFAGFRSCALP